MEVVSDLLLMKMIKKKMISKFLRFIRNYAPFIMVCYSFIFTLVCKFIPFEYIQSVYPYLSQGIGFSFFTNLVMASFYFNTKYCDAIKIALIGLFLMNIASIICVYYDKSNLYYDFFIGLSRIFYIS